MRNSRKKILDAATAVFSKRGYHQAQIEEIARRAGVGKGTVYIHFSSKAALFSAVVSEGFEEMMSKVREELESELPFPRHLEKIVARNVSLYLKNGELSKILFNELSSGVGRDALKEILAARENYVEFLAELLAEGHKRGYIIDTDFRLAAVAMIGMMDGLLNHHFRNPDAVTEEQIVGAMYTFVSSGLLAMK